MKPNGTDAKDVALYFLDKTVDNLTPQLVAKTINQAKNMLNKGHNKEDIIKVIDHIVEVKKVKMYSIGYINYSIDDILQELTDMERAEYVKREMDKVKEQIASTIQEVGEMSDETKERNKRKLAGFGKKSGFGEKSSFDMLKR